MHYLLHINWILIAAIWYAVNGILHDLFVLKNHSGGYNRELLRLLMDGHVLIFSGILLFVSWLMLRQQTGWGAVLGLITGVAMIVYCAMIFPFLKSFGTLLISMLVCAVCVAFYFQTRS